MKVRTIPLLVTFHTEIMYPIQMQTKTRTNQTQKHTIKIVFPLRDKKATQARQAISAIYCHSAKYSVLSLSCTHQSTQGSAQQIVQNTNSRKIRDSLSSHRTICHQAAARRLQQPHFRRTVGLQLQFAGTRPTKSTDKLYQSKRKLLVQ